MFLTEENIHLLFWTTTGFTNLGSAVVSNIQHTPHFFLTPTPLTTSPKTLITGAGGVLLLSWATHPIKGLKIWHYCLWILAALNLWIHKHNDNFLPVRLWLWIWCDGTEQLPDLKKDKLHNTQVFFLFSSLFRTYIQLKNLAPTDWC